MIGHPDISSPRFNLGFRKYLLRGDTTNRALLLNGRNSECYCPASKATVCSNYDMVKFLVKSDIGFSHCRPRWPSVGSFFFLSRFLGKSQILPTKNSGSPTSFDGFFFFNLVK